MSVLIVYQVQYLQSKLSLEVTYRSLFATGIISVWNPQSMGLAALEVTVSAEV